MRLWAETIEGRRSGFASAITIFEISRLSCKGVIPRSFADVLVELLPQACTVVWPDTAERLVVAARLGQGHGSSMADALVLSALLEAGRAEIYTTDGDLLRYRSKRVTIRILALF